MLSFVASDEADLVAALRRGEESAFATLVDAYGGSLLALAGHHVASRAAAEEVVQDTWLGVMRGIDRFQGRSTLKTWLFRILVNTAKTRGLRERRTVPFSAVPAADRDEAGLPRGARGPRPAEGGPDERLLAAEACAAILGAIGALAPVQRTVITRRDIEGRGPQEVCAELGLSPENQRVLLHRARVRVRAAVASADAP